MKQRKNRAAVSTVCLIQLTVCSVLLLAILVWKLIGGAAYETAAAWYRETVSDSILVSPAVSLPPDEESSHA